MIFDPNVQLPKAPRGYLLRPLMLSDHKHGYLKLLSQLTVVGKVTEEMFSHRFHLMRNTFPITYYVVVIEHEETKCVVATATLVLEWKFIHEAGCRGRIEDVVVDVNARRQSLATLLILHLVTLARHLGVYKLSLECKKELISFYERFGFQRDDNNFLVINF
ncbi:unnamed protein product [Thelazia callipaeda]|uniref:Glucosamine 6-phosphate N-acetyltransferase n=1 Tax=Thelazia callipaeda TaxID=103827 RepID=A0A0N5D892_THECL|nr:unnamed protein product [Thelazia callipaeda]